MPRKSRKKKGFRRNKIRDREILRSVKRWTLMTQDLVLIQLRIR